MEYRKQDEFGLQRNSDGYLSVHFGEIAGTPQYNNWKEIVTPFLK